MGDNDTSVTAHPPPGHPPPPPPKGEAIAANKPEVPADESNTASYPPRSSSYAHNFSRKPVIGRKPIPGQENVKVGPSRYRGRRTSSGQHLEEPVAQLRASVTPSSGQSTPSRDGDTPETGSRNSDASLPQTIPFHLRHEREPSDTLPRSYADEISHVATPIPGNSQSQAVDNAGTPTEGSISAEDGQIEMQPQFQYLHEDNSTRR